MNLMDELFDVKCVCLYHHIRRILTINIELMLSFLPKTPIITNNTNNKIHHWNIRPLISMMKVWFLKSIKDSARSMSVF